ncbi:MAG: maltose alpha-D-glucosyltransferase [Dehalococcoidia bacterium]
MMHASDNKARNISGQAGSSGQVTPEQSPGQPSADYIQWLESRSMLYQAEHLSELIAGKSLQWRNAYGRPRPQDFVRAASVWFTSYPKATISHPDRSVLQTLGSKELLSTFKEIGIEGIHTGPMRRAGGITGREYTPSIDGLFDRIELTIDPLFGTDDEYVQMTRAATQSDIAVIGDLVPAHTGKGADFRLAELAYKNYEGLYTMVEIPEEDWELLGPVPEGEDSVNLTPETVQLLEDKGYIPGPTECIVFHDPGIKDTNWSATDTVTGVDGRRRRWVYLHVFKDGQPSLNWLDPTLGAQRVIMADVVHALHVLGASGLRLDASPLLGIETRPGLDKAWVEGHPLAEGGSNLIAMMIRKLGGYSFQELNQPLENLKKFSTWGPDLSYDFFTRPPYLYAMAVGDAGPLRLMLRLIQKQGLDQSILVHALQNHDELMFDVTHLRKHGNKKFRVNGEEMTGRAIYDGMYERAKDKIMGSEATCIREFSNLGFCGTLAGFAAAALGIPDPYNMTPSQKAEVQQLHLLAAVFNAMQPGVFALSGWDLVGALLVQPEELGSWLDDRDYRWMNRGAFDLMGVNPSATASNVGLPRAVAIYGTLPEQLRDPDSFASQLKRMFRARRGSRIAFSKLVSVPEVDKQGIVVMLLQRPEDLAWIITALNFGREPVGDAVRLPELAGKSPRLIFSTQREKAKGIQISDQGDFSLDLGPIQGEVFVVE